MKGQYNLIELVPLAPNYKEGPNHLELRFCHLKMLIEHSRIIWFFLVLYIGFSQAHPIAVKVSNASLPAEVFLSKQRTAIKSSGTPVDPEKARLFEWLTNMFSGQSSSDDYHDDDCDYASHYHDDYHHGHHGHHGHGHGHDYEDEEYDEYDNHHNHQKHHQRPTNRPGQDKHILNNQASLAADQSSVVIGSLPMPPAYEKRPSMPVYSLNPAQQHNLHRPIRIHM
ncbi:unnamed protein product [Allacma fusca]|uniref:Uncharacterized protein n=1 Tax=Allacma fusca TaxID=39272 RepID=A0A8J2NZT3_9HEXA|nr:unnamed protein product [Allacma fusca]